MKEDNSIKKTVDILRELISEKGYDYIYNDAYSVHQTLIDEGIDKRICDVTLYALVSGTARDNKSDIEDEVYFNLYLKNKMADAVLEIFSSLYDERILSSMKKEEYKGLREFLSKEWDIKSSGSATWRYKGGSSTDYSYTFTMTVRVIDKDIVKKEMEKKLSRNPFLKAEDIRLYYEKMIDEFIFSNFDEYCTSDDYYPPVVEDFFSEIDDDLDEVLSDHGLEMIDDDYNYREGDIYW